MTGSVPALEAMYGEFVEVLRVKLNAEEKLIEIFDKFVAELGDAEQRFSDQEIRAITKRIEAMSEEMGAIRAGWRFEAALTWNLLAGPSQNRGIVKL
jgi:hypothetical protein